MIASPAARALKTAQIFAENLGFEPSRIQEKMAIYDGLNTAEFLSIVHKLPENAQTVFFFGHNPGFHYLVSNLLNNFWGEMPTCSTVGIDFEVGGWSEIEVRTGKTAFQLVPKNFQ
jgi:phosphohistidine phosphatase